MRALQGNGLAPDGPSPAVELLARAIHRVYLDKASAAPQDPDDPAERPWEALDQSLRDSNLDHARHIAGHLHSVGLAVAPLDGHAAVLTDDEIERLSRLEHARWVEDRRAQGWRSGSRDPVARTTPYLVPWDDLDEEVRELDRLFVRELPGLLATVGLQIVRPVGWIIDPSQASAGSQIRTHRAVPDPVQLAWDRHLAWSHTADRLKGNRERLGAVVLLLALLGAVLAAVVIATGTHGAVGRTLAFGSAACVGVAGVLKSRSGTQVVRDWTRARSVSEAIKSEVYVHLATGGEGEALERCVSRLEEEASDLPQPPSATAAPRQPPPPVHDLESYLRERVVEQARDYYRPRARALERRASVVRRVTLGLGVGGALLASAAATWETSAMAAWVPVTTTVAAAVSGRAAAARYDFLIVEYTRTAAELERLAHRQQTGAALGPADLVAAAESTISTQNRGWMARLATADDHE